MAIQNQIEALQQQQQALYQQQLASAQAGQFGGNRGSTHRRVQSTLPDPSAAFNAAQSQMGQFGQFGNLGTLNMGLDGQAQGIPRGHGRRHSVNVVNKASSQNSLGMGIGNMQDGFDDGFAAPAALGGHSRQASRADSSWRISEYNGSVINSHTDAHHRWRSRCCPERWCLRLRPCTGPGPTSKPAAIPRCCWRSSPQDGVLQLP